MISYLKIFRNDVFLVKMPMQKSPIFHSDDSNYLANLYRNEIPIIQELAFL